MPNTLITSIRISLLAGAVALVSLGCDRDGVPEIPAQGEPGAAAAAEPEASPEVVTAFPEGATVISMGSMRVSEIEALADQEAGDHEPGRATVLPAAAYSLRGTSWAWRSESAWASLRFGDVMLTVAAHDREAATEVADFSGNHGLCFGQPLCVVLLSPPSGVRVQHFHLDDDGRLRLVQCVDWREVGESEQPPSDEVLLRASGQVVTSRAFPYLCMHALTAPAFDRVE